MPDTPTAPPAATTRRATTTGDQREVLVARVVLVLTGLVFVVLAASRISAPFGDSDEGINGAVWARDSRALRELGPIDSALGGRRGDGTSYANHPPLLVVEAAAVESVVGERAWATRAPAWLGALASIPLLYWLLRRARFAPLAASFGTATACLTPMFVVYGPMLDTPVTSFPLGVAVVALWLGDWSDDRAQPWWLVALVSAAACLAGWEAALLVAVCAVTLAVHHRRSGSAALRRGAPYAVGGAVGLAGSLAWIRWVYGGFGPLTDKFARRAGDAATSYLDIVTFQVPWIVQLLSLSVVGLVACIVAVRDRRRRPLALVSLGITFGYAFIFKEAAAGHQYWLYWVLLPTAVGMAFLGEAVTRKVRAESTSPAAPLVALCGGLVVLGAVNLVPGTTAERLIVDGQAAGRLVDTLPEGSTLHYIGEEQRADDYVAYYLRTAPVRLDGAAALDELAGRDPGAPVLVLASCGSDDQWCDSVLDRVGTTGGVARLVTAEQVRGAVDEQQAG